jgi:hypothetical protein
MREVADLEKIFDPGTNEAFALNSGNIYQMFHRTTFLANRADRSEYLYQYQLDRNSEEI